MNLIIENSVKEHFQKNNSMAQLVLNQINEGFYGKFEDRIKDGIVLDLGANIGLFSAFAAQTASYVYAVEPTISHQNVFKELVSLNGVENVKLIEAALCAEEGDLDFYESLSNSTMNSIFAYEPNSSTTYKVKGITLENILEEIKDEVDFMKMDIEGSEKFLIGSADFFNSLVKIKSMFLEIHKEGSQSFDEVRNAWKTKLLNVFDEVEYVGVDGLYAYKM